MTAKFPQTVTKIIKYIEKHESYFGFKPSAYYLKRDDWSRLQKDIEQWSKFNPFMPLNQPVQTIFINGVPIYPQY